MPVLATALKMVHSARWRKTLSAADSADVLAAAASSLGDDPGVAKSAYPGLLLEGLDSGARTPTAHQALAATLAVLDRLAVVNPDLADRIMARVEPGHRRKPPSGDRGR